MKSVLVNFENAVRLERILFDLAEQIANEQRKPASLRDTQKISADWAQMLRYQPKLASLIRASSKLKRPARRQLSRSEYDMQREIYLAVKASVKRLRLWSVMEQLVERHINPARTPLLPVRPPNSSDAILTMIDRAFHRLANPHSQDKTAIDHGCFADIAMPIQRFERLMSAAYRVTLVQNREWPVRFLDVGCGGGTRVYSATRFFPRADGLEYDRGYAGAADHTMKAIGADQCTIIHGDALTFENYGDYDVIYFYRPLRSDKLLLEMVQRIINHARNETILVAPYEEGFGTLDSMTCARIEGPVFVTGLSQPEADQLRCDAEATGTSIIKRSRDYRFDTGFWTPILDTASFNGEA